jgi:hypothetical protein
MLPDLKPASSPANPLILRQSALVRFCRRDVDLDFIVAAHFLRMGRRYHGQTDVYELGRDSCDPPLDDQRSF